MAVLERDGRDVHYQVVDRGASEPTCLFVHGSGADRRVWKAQHRLGSTRRSVFVDLPGHGESDDIATPPGPETLAVYAGDVAAVAAATDADVLIGNSLGGAVVQWAILEGAADPEGAVLVGTGAKLAVREDLRGWLTDDFERAIEFLHGTNRLFADPSPAMLEASTAAMRECGRETTRRDYLTCHTFDVRDRLADIELPVLAICGEQDALTPPAYHEYLAGEIAHAQLEVVPEAAHLVMLERPEPFNAAVDAFAAQLG